ncbi:MAG: hypothetical protein IKB82_01245 [Clostridia bacterium]|nr:hypothetical protein [Clostridia bacterium]
MKRIMGLLTLAALLVLLTGCTAVDQALSKIGSDIEAAQVKSAGTSDKSGLDWAFVPVLRERAKAMFTEAFPEYPVTDASVACKDERRVIVTLTYTKDGVSGKYGFDYKLGEDGEYALDRYGDGVDSGDL